MQQNKTALMKAAELLARQEQSSQHLRRKLSAKKYSAAEIDNAIETLTERNYLNDEETCKRQFENFYAEEKLSVKQICMKLYQRGFDRDFIKNLIPADCEERDKKVAEKIFAKKFANLDLHEVDNKEKFKIKNKIYQHFASKGFSTETISAVMNFD